MSKGVDYNQTTTEDIASCLVAEGYTFVCRYYGLTKHEPLTREEALLLSSHGLYIVPVWESSFPTNASYFSLSQGIEDGTACYNYAMNTIGQPAGSSIYFTVDYDAHFDDLLGIRAYFRGLRIAFFAGTGNPSHRYLIGVYGSGLVCNDLLEDGLVHRTWLAFAPGWSGSGFAGANLIQTGSGTVCSLDVDFDTSNGDAGGFKL